MGDRREVRGRAEGAVGRGAWTFLLGTGNREMLARDTLVTSPCFRQAAKVMVRHQAGPSLSGESKARSRVGKEGA